MENKQLLHVAVETLVLGGVTLFLTKKIKKCKEENDALREEFNKYKEQNDKNLKYLFSLIDSLSSGSIPPPISVSKPSVPRSPEAVQNEKGQSMERFSHAVSMDPISALMSQMGVPLMNMNVVDPHSQIPNEQIMMMHMQVENPRRRKNVPNIEPVPESVSQQSILIQDDNNDDDIREELEQLNNMNNTNEHIDIEPRLEEEQTIQNDEKEEEIFIPEPSKYKKKSKK
jgi:hypothetical protein